MFAENRASRFHHAVWYGLAKYWVMELNPLVSTDSFPSDGNGFYFVQIGLNFNTFGQMICLPFIFIDKRWMFLFLFLFSLFKILKDTPKVYDQLLIDYSLKNQLRYKGNLGEFNIHEWNIYSKVEFWNLVANGKS